MRPLCIALCVIFLIISVGFSNKSKAAVSGPGKKASIIAAVFLGLFSLLSFLIGVVPTKETPKIDESEPNATFYSSNSVDEKITDDSTERVTLSDVSFSDPAYTEDSQGVVEVGTTRSPSKSTGVILEWNGIITKDDQEDSYPVFIDKSGTYRFEISDLNAEKEISMFLKDDGGGEITRKTWIGNGDGITRDDLKAGRRYYVVVQQASGYTPYTLKIGTQQDTVDINGADSIDGEIEFTDQVNKYSFCPTMDGTYRFEINDLYAEKRISMYITDEGDGLVKQNTWIQNGDGITTDQLRAHHQYTILIKQAQGLSRYTLKIGYQTETKYIYDNSVEMGAITFKDQVNYYSFTPSLAKQYRFELNEIQSQKKVSLYISDQGGGTLEKNTWIGNGEGISTERLKAGEEYFIKVAYADGFTPYTLTVK